MIFERVVRPKARTPGCNPGNGGSNPSQPKHGRVGWYPWTVAHEISGGETPQQSNVTSRPTATASSFELSTKCRRLRNGWRSSI